MGRRQDEEAFEEFRSYRSEQKKRTRKTEVEASADKATVTTKSKSRKRSILKQVKEGVIMLILDTVIVTSIYITKFM